MNKTFTILILLLTLSGCSEEKKCSDFKVGNFKISNPELSDWIISRTDSTQTEINSNTGMKIYNSIEWKTDCEYILTYTKVLNPGSQVVDFIGKKVKIKIIETNSGGYICKTNINDIELEMVKID